MSSFIIFWRPGSQYHFPIPQLFRSIFILHLTIGSVDGRDRMVVGFTTTCAIRAYRH